MSNIQHDPDEIRRLLEVREAERLTYKQLSERSGVAVHVLAYRSWQDRRRGEKSEARAGCFVEVVGEPSREVPPGGPSGLELLFPWGMRCLLARDFDEGALGRLLTLARC